MSGQWYSRPVLSVLDLERSLEFYIDKLGFTLAWRYADEGQGGVAQVDRNGTELILSSHWQDKAGSATIFVSLDLEVLEAARAEFETKGVEVKDGWWGYKLMIVEDPAGNRLFFAYPKDTE